MDLFNLWNQTEKPDECNVQAKEGDLLTFIDGVIFLLQRTEDCNNLVMFRISPGTFRFKKIISRLYCWLVSNNIQYIRIEGNTKRYSLLTFIQIPCYRAVQDLTVKDRNVFYCKLY